MKHTHLSQFQKQQYTAYLESQLQKFSAFMLSQKKENEKYKQFEQVIVHHSNLIEQLQAKIQMIDVYQNQILQNEENLFKKCERQQDLDIRLRRLQDRDRFDCDREARKHQLKERRDNQTFQDKENGYENACRELNRRLKVVQERISKQTSLSGPMNLQNPEINKLFQEAASSKIRKVQKKMKKYFSTKFQDIEFLIKKVKKNKSKSPTARTPINISLTSRQAQSVTPLTQFKLEDNSINKSDLSTVLRDSKNTTISNRHKFASEFVKEKKGKKNKDKEDNSRSKSKSKKKDKSKSKKKDQSRSLSKSKVLDKSYQISDRSNIYSSLSRSKSNLSKDEVLSKKKNKISRRKSKRSVSKSRSDYSSISLHQKCKKRPEYPGLLLQNDKSKQKMAPARKKSKLNH